MSESSPTIAAVILAGGRGERLGGTLKSNLMVGGKRLLDRVAEALGNVSPLLLAHGRHDALALGPTKAMVPVADPAGDVGGPLAGLAAAVAWCALQPAPPRFLLTVAVDTPFLPADFQWRLEQAVGDRDAAIAAYDGQAYPTNGLWRFGPLADLAQQIAEGRAPRSLKRLAAELGATTVNWPPGPGGDPFANVNTAADLLALELRLARAAAIE